MPQCDDEGGEQRLIDWKRMSGDVARGMSASLVQARPKETFGREMVHRLGGAFVEVFQGTKMPRSDDLNCNLNFAFGQEKRAYPCG